MYECMNAIVRMLTKQIHNHWEQTRKTASGTNNTRLNFIQDDHSNKGKDQLRKPNLLPAFIFTEEKHNPEVAK